MASETPQGYSIRILPKIHDPLFHPLQWEVLLRAENSAPDVAIVEEDRSGGIGGRDGGRGRRGSQEGGGRTQVSAGA